MNYSERLPQHFPADLPTSLVSKIRLSYEDNYDNHDISLGHDAASYGILVHKTVCHRLKELREESGIDVRPKSGSVELRVGPYTLRPYKLGESEEDDVWTSYPNNLHSSALLQMASRNNAPLLPGIDWSEPVEPFEPTDFVIGHFGAYDDEQSEGCRAVYLCVPRYVNGNFGGWENCIKIYDASEEEGNYQQGVDNLPAVEITDVPEVEFGREPEVERTEEPEIDTVDKGEEPSSKEEG